MTLPPAGQSRNREQPEFVDQPHKDKRIMFSVDGLRHNNVVIAYDTRMNWITYLMSVYGKCPDCDMHHSRMIENTKMGTVRVWRADDGR